MRISRMFCQRGSKFDNVFFVVVFCGGGLLFPLVDEEIEDQNTTINGPSSVRQRNAYICAIFRGARGSANDIGITGQTDRGLILEYC